MTILNNKQLEIAGQAVDAYGVEGQLGMLQEECAELIVAVNHYKRNRVPKEDIAEEIADVLIMAAQIDIGLNLKKELEDAIDSKVKRLKNRLTRSK